MISIRRIVMLIKCTCKNDYQDKKYGEQVRVMNKTEKKSGDKVVFRCTVCTKEVVK